MLSWEITNNACKAAWTVNVSNMRVTGLAIFGPSWISKTGRDQKIQLFRKGKNTGVWNEMQSKFVNTPKINESNIQA